MDDAGVTLTGFSLPHLSAFGPPVEGEGSLDPIGLAAISDRLANLLVPGLRARMRRVRFVTAIAVGPLACETLTEEIAADGVASGRIPAEKMGTHSFTFAQMDEAYDVSLVALTTKTDERS